MSSHVILLPLAQQVDEEVSTELLGEDLREEIEVGDESGLQNDGDVRGVEKLDGVRLLVALHLSRRDGQLNSETLELNMVSNLNSIRNVGWLWVRHLRKMISRTELALCVCSANRTALLHIIESHHVFHSFRDTYLEVDDD